MPANTLKVDRTTRWGNPFKVGATAVHPATGRRIRVASRAMAVELFAGYLRTPAGRALAKEARRALKGRNLACWCPLGGPCHGDVLLRVVNAGDRSTAKTQRGSKSRAKANGGGAR
jgi:hypothetical protein